MVFHGRVTCGVDNRQCIEPPNMDLIDLILMLGGLLAALAVSAVCGLGLVVWLAGGHPLPPKTGH